VTIVQPTLTRDARHRACALSSVTGKSGLDFSPEPADARPGRVASLAEDRDLSDVDRLAVPGTSIFVGEKESDPGTFAGAIA
jgi:hypothetical protein